MVNLTPKKIVEELAKYIIGQEDAKKAVAVALRNRWRRMQLECGMQREVTPKNILMIGPTGVGKTEIARRLAGLTGAPFIKVEATKFTEVGYVGKDVESIIRDLVDAAVKNIREHEKKRVQEKAKILAEERVLDVLVPVTSAKESKVGFANEIEHNKNEVKKENSTREIFRKKLRNGDLDDKEIDIKIAPPTKSVGVMGPPGMEEITGQIQNMFSNMSAVNKKNKKMKIKDALKLILDEEASNLVDEESINSKAINSVEQNGIVFLDEIDKVCKKSSNNSADVSREGVQRDLLPLVEGSTVNTKYGMIKTDHILFIASGAFHVAKPSDLIPELQGRLPIRVELSSLNVDDFVRILKEPSYSLVEQYIALLATEGLSITFAESALQRIAEIAFSVNEHVENIGARRLHTVLEKLLEEVSFNAAELEEKQVVIDEEYVNGKLAHLVQDKDLSQYIL